MAPGRGSTGAGRLVAVLLVTRSRPGPKLVFHYPPDPQPIPSGRDGTRNGFNLDDNSDSDAENENLSLLAGSGTPGQPEKSASPERDGPSSSTTTAATDRILGFSEDSLEKILSPGCWCDRKKFEVCLNGLTFVGHPVHADHDGSWARKHTHVTHADHGAYEDAQAPFGITVTELPPAPVTASKAARVDYRDYQGAQTPFRIPTPELPQQPSKASRATRADYGYYEDAQTPFGIAVTEPVHDFTHVPDSLQSQYGPSLATSMNSASTLSTAGLELLTSLHVVFVLTKSHSETRQRDVSDMYEHVAKKLTKALHYCQRQTSYVGVETKKLLALKTRAKQEGANATVLCERMLDASELAWALKEVYDKISTGEVAGIRLDGMQMSLQIPLEADEMGDGSGGLDRHSGLLLLEDKDILLRELAHPDASPLAHFIREHTPTKSLQKHATKLGMAINDIVYLARHLIKWRKARSIAPLHPRNTYIVGPNAPLDQLDRHMQEYARKFSALPSLAQVLKVLSGRPIKYGLLIPSRDHRAPYVDILAYLVRHRFVEQLKTFGWLQAPLEPRRPLLDASVDNKNRRPLSVASLLSPQLRPADDDSASVSSERTAIPLSENAKKEDVIKGDSGVDSREHDTARIITDPLAPSPEDAQRLQNITEWIEDAELQDRLPSLLQHFDGETALENIAASQGLKRSKVETWLALLQSDGFLLTFRHL